MAPTENVLSLIFHLPNPISTCVVGDELVGDELVGDELVGDELEEDNLMEDGDENGDEDEAGDGGNLTGSNTPRFEIRNEFPCTNPREKRFATISSSSPRYFPAAKSCSAKPPAFVTLFRPFLYLRASFQMWSALTRWTGICFPPCIVVCFSLLAESLVLWDGEGGERSQARNGKRREGR